MKKIVPLLTICVFLLTKAYSQEVKVGFQTGLGQYKMTDLKNLNSYIVTNNPVNPKKTSNYPQFLYYQPSLTFAFNKVGLGVFYSFNSTGSRISVKDYTGEYLFNTKIKCNSIGLSTELYLSSDGKFKYHFYSDIGISFTKLNMTEFFRLYDDTSINDNMDFTSKNYFIQPGLKVLYPLMKFNLELNLGYLVQFGGGPLKGAYNSSISVDGKVIKPNWGGFRLGLAVNIPLK